MRLSSTKYEHNINSPHYGRERERPEADPESADVGVAVALRGGGRV